MADNEKAENPKVVAKAVADTSSALEKKAQRFSLVWVVPCIALLLTSWVIWNNTINIGPEIKIVTNNAEGIEKGKTLIKTRSVTVGMVTNVELAEDYSSTILTVQMNKDTENLLRPDTLFWVVKPRIEKAGVSGLDTLLSGSYIQLNIGTQEGFKTEFTALSSPPVRRAGEKGLIVSLYSNASRKLSPGDTVYFRGFEVGAITETALDMESQLIHYRAFIRSPYDVLVNNNTRFWISSGFEFKLSPDGAEIHTESLNSIIAGGISFDNFVESVDLINSNISNFKQFDKEKIKKSDDIINLDPNVVAHMYTNIKSTVKDDAVYKLFDRREDARIDSLEGGLLYVVMLEGDIGNIEPGSAIMFKGVKVGEVVKAPWFEDKSEVFSSEVLPVLIALDSSDSKKQQEIKSIVDGYLKKSHLCVSIGSSNLIFNNNQLTLIHDPKTKCSTNRDMYKIAHVSKNKDTNLMAYRSHHIIPLVPSESLSTQFDSFMEKLNTFDVSGFSTELQNSLKAFSEAMHAFTLSNQRVQDSDVINRVSRAFDNFNETIKGYGENTPIYKNLNQNLKNIEQILQDISPTARELGQDPASIIFGAPEDPQPQAPKQK